MSLKKDNRRILTWSHLSTGSNYRNSIKNYWNRIYSVGLHEFGVRASGKIYNYRTGVDYFNSNGSHTGVKFPVIMESDMINYPTIKWFFQCICFGWNTVKPFLDNDTLNAEGRLPQDQFILEMGKILDLYKNDRNSGRPLTIDGVEMDVEASMTSDTVSQGHDVKYVRFLEKLKNELLIPRGLRLRVNVHAMWGNNVPYYYRFHNYKLMAESADRRGKATIDEIQLMTYDFAWSGSSAGASTPIWWFKDVAEWCITNFDPKRNPNAKLTMDNLFFGAAGYGNRWGMHNQEVVKRGTSITYHNLLGWQNGMYRHFRLEDDVYIYNDQEYLYQTSFQDEESKNEVMYPHVYDMFKPKYTDVKRINGGNRTAVVGTYNRLDYAATNFKQQIPIWTGIKAIANRPSSISGKAYPLNVERWVEEYAANRGIDVRDLSDDLRQTWDTNLNPESVSFRHLIRTIEGKEEVFVSWFTEDRLFVERNEYDKEGNVLSAYCELEDKADGRIHYDINVPTSGSYKLIAIPTFSWFTQNTIGGYVNGQRFTVGGEHLPEWYPFFMQGGHFYDCGRFNFTAGSNRISVHGELSTRNTPISGFVICEDFDQNFTGGELAFNSNIQPFLMKDGTEAPLPTTFALACKMLRRDARPALLWDDEFRTYEEGTDLATTTYYQRIVRGHKRQGDGDFVEQVGMDFNDQPIYKCFSSPHDIGFSQGIWKQEDDGTTRQAVRFDSDETEQSIGARSGQLVLSRKWYCNLSIESRIKAVRGGRAGIRFFAQSEGTVADGYIFMYDFSSGTRELVYEDFSTGRQTTVASQRGNLQLGDSFTLKVLTHNGKARFYVNGVQVFIDDSGNPVTHDGLVSANGEVSLVRSSGAIGLYGSNVEMYCYHLGIGTLDRWETLEKFEVWVDGQKREFGRINRTGYTYDEYGYLVYSGFDEKVTRDNNQFFDEDRRNVSLDYEITVLDWDSWEDDKDVTIKLVDAGVWFGELLIGDREGMSVIWTGDCWSISEILNMAVNDFGAKGLGLWAMGQEDPRIWEMVPEVVSKIN